MSTFRYILEVMLVCMSLMPSTEGVEIPVPENITVNSTNLKHILSWNRLSAVWGNVTYTVEIQGEFERVYKNRTWTGAAHCQSISVPWCNVTDDMPTNVLYRLRVRAEVEEKTSNWAETFFHRNSTLLVPPTINILVREFQLTMVIKDLEPLFQYYIFYWRKGQEEETKALVTNRQATAIYLNDVEPMSEYCAYVIAQAVPIGRNSSRSTQSCVIVPAKKPSSLVIAIVSIFGVIAGLVLLALLLWNAYRLIHFSCFPEVDIPEALMMTSDSVKVNKELNWTQRTRVPIYDK